MDKGKMKNQKIESQEDDVIVLEVEEVTEEQLLMEFSNQIRNLSKFRQTIPLKPRNFTWEEVETLYNEIETNED